MNEVPLNDLERRTLEAFRQLDDEDRKRMLMVIAAMRAGIEIDPSDLVGKSTDELRQYADRMWQQIAAIGSQH